MKPFKTIDEQISILSDRGLTINNQEQAKKLLLQNNYYVVINEYSKFLMLSDDRYIDGATIEEVDNIRGFDFKFQNTLFLALLQVEKRFKAVLSYYFSNAYPSDYAYLNINNLECSTQKDMLEAVKISSNLSKIISQYAVDKKYDNAISHYWNKHKNIPLWVLINFMTFGDTLMFYRCCKRYIKNSVAKEFSKMLQENTNASTGRIEYADLITIFYQVKFIRNIVAHSNKLFDCSVGTSIPYIKEIHEPLKIDRSINRTSAYQTILIMKCLLSAQEYNDLITSVIILVDEFKNNIHSINYMNILHSLGFPDDWKEMLQLSLAKTSPYLS